jgi:hypothetical protein
MNARAWTARAPLAVALTIFAVFGACDCEDPINQINEPPGPACQLDTTCGDREAYRGGECRPSGCETDLDCCPGTRCRLDFNACVPHQLDAEYDCDTDADCPDAAQRCQTVTLGPREPIQACVYERCEGDADCGFGRSCYESVCVQTAPCGGSCPAGEACDVLTSQCAPVAETAAGCAEACEGGLRVLRDPDTMTGDICCEAACVCRGLPPIVPVNFGKYARVTIAGDQLLVSAYDGTFGDLVVAHFSKAGEIIQVDYVDGIPLGAGVAADPDGPRGGVAEPGPNVGTHTSIAANAEGLARVAYHDVDNRLLKVALQNSNGSWSSHTVDAPGDGGRVGHFTDIAVAPDGTIFVSYLAEDVTGAPGIGGTASAAKVARSRNATPGSAADWELFFVDARPSFDPCDGACGATEGCVIGGNGPTCAAEATGCADCGAAQLCVLTNGQPTCAANAIPPSAAEFPRARGLYTSLILDEGDAVVVYYDSIDKDLRGGRLAAGGQVNANVIDGDGLDGSRTTDAGRYPAIAKVGNEFLVLYEDFTRHEVRAWQGSALGTGGVFSTVDRGKVTDQPGKRFVGATLAVANQNGNSPFIVYQDASTLDLKSGQLNGADWTLGTLLTDGSHGFYTDVVIQGTEAFIVSVLAELDARGRERARLGMTVQALP